MFDKNNNLKVMCALLLAVFSIAGCTIGSVNSRTSDVTPHKLSNINVEWVSNPKLKYKVTKFAQAVTKEKAEQAAKINAVDKAVALREMKQLVSAFSKSAATMLENKLNDHGVAKGDSNLLKIMPVKAGVILGGGRSIHIQITIISTSPDAQPWSAQISVNGTRSTDDSEFAEKFAKTVFSELRSSGWI